MSFWPHIIRRNGPWPVGKGGNLVIPATGWQKKLIQQWVSDVCELTGEGKAEVYKRVLTERAVPVDGSEGDRIENVLADADDRDSNDPYPEKRGVCRGVEEAFDDLSTELENGYPFGEVGLPYIKMMMSISRSRNLRIHPPIENNDPRHNLNWYATNRVIPAVEKAGRSVPFEVKAAFGNDGSPAVYPVFQFIVRNWDLLDKRETFNFLAYLCASTDNWNDTPQERAMFTDASVQAHHARKRWEEEQSALAQKRYRDLVLICYAMANGDYVEAPKGWRAIAPEISATCSHAGVIEIRNGDRFHVPHFLFFIDHPIKKITKSERDQLLRSADAIWPEGSMKDIIDAEIELKYAADGGIVNYEAYLSSPRIGFFEVPDAGAFLNGMPPSDAKVYRAQRGGDGL